MSQDKPTVKHAILKDAFIYTAANYGSDALGILVSILSKRFLGVVGAGYWTVLSVMQSYGMYATLGAKNAVFREIPQAIGAKQPERAKELQNSAYSYVLICGLIGALGFWIASEFFFHNPALKAGTKVIAFLVLILNLYNLALTLLRARKKFAVLGKIIVLNMVFVFCFALTGAYFFNVTGYACGLTLATLLSYGLAKKWGEMNFSFRLRWNEIRQLVVIGLPMVAASFLLRTFLSIDQIMVAKMLGAKSLGLYTVGLMAVQQVAAVPKFFGVALFPHIQERFGETKRAEDLRSMILKPTYFFSRVVPIFLGGVIFLLPVLVHYVLPQFKAGIPAMKILVFGYYFVIISEMSSTLLFTLDKQVRMAAVYGLLVLVAMGLNYVFISAGYGLLGAALATSISYCLFFMTLFTWAARQMMGWNDLLKFYSGVTISFLYFAISIVWIDRALNVNHVLGTALLKLLGLLVVSLPVLWRLERKEKLAAMVKQAFVEKFKS